MEAYRRHLAAPRPSPPELAADRETTRRIIREAKEAHRGFITEEAAAAVAKAYGIRTPGGGLVPDLASARRMASQLTYPLVMKIASPDILHKRDIDGIRLGIGDEQQLTVAYEDIMENVQRRMPDAQVWGVELQEMITGGVETIVGVNRDPTFGPLLLFGLGGVYVEVLKDVVFRLCPVDPAEARAMISEIRGFAMLRGARGGKPADIDAIIDALVRVSRLATDFPEVLGPGFRSGAGPATGAPSSPGAPW
jgi:acetyltransferase